MCVCMHACMYTCMHVCMHACMHVCTHVCIYACMYACIYVFMYVCMYVSMHVCLSVMHACMYIWMYVCTYACLYVCMYMCMWVLYVHHLLRLTSQKKFWQLNMSSDSGVYEKSAGIISSYSVGCRPPAPPHPMLSINVTGELAISNFFFARSSHSWRPWSTLDCEGWRGSEALFNIADQRFFCKHRYPHHVCLVC